MQVMGDSVGAAGDLTVVSSFDDEARNGLRLVGRIEDRLVGDRSSP